MSDFGSKQVIEALRSGVPSRAVGMYFSEARPGVMKKITAKLDHLQEDGASDGFLYTGRYGEGKTHLLNTVFGMAAERNMVVSYVSLGKETPLDKPEQLYRKLIASSYLPGARQPGFRTRLMEELTPGSSLTGDLLAFSARELNSDKLYYLLKALVATKEEDSRELLLADLEGDYTSDAAVKRIYRAAIGKPAKISVPFSKRKHTSDYFHFISHLFSSFGYSGWVLLFDEAELISRFSKKARAKCYCELWNYLHPEGIMERAFTLFAFSSSYAEDVIDRKNELESVNTIFEAEPDLLKKATAGIQAILNAPELPPLNRDEIREILLSIVEFHSKAYDWSPFVAEDDLMRAAEGGGYLLRTRIRAAIEYLDQLYLYGEAGETGFQRLDQERLDEEDDPVPDLSDLDSLPFTEFSE